MSQTIQTGSFRWMKSINKSTILNVIRLQGPVSRAEIAKVTRLTPPTVTNIVGELLRDGWVVECELGESTGGRKPILLNINHGAFNVVGVYAGVKTIRVLSADLAGNTGDEQLLAVPSRPTVKTYTDLLTGAVGSVVDRIRGKGIPLLGIGVGMHGLVDPREGVSRFAPNLAFTDLPLRSILEEKFNVSVEVENDVRARAVGESWFGHGRGADPFICVHVGTGVGAGMMYEGRLLHGPSFTAGELGHTVIDPAGPVCGCGNRGCLEAFVSGPATLERARRRLAAGEPSLLRSRVGADGEQLSGPDLTAAAAEGDRLAVEELAETGRCLGIALANLINLLNPRKIILSGGMIAAGAFVLDPLRRTVEERVLSTPAKEVSIVVSELGERAGVIGAFTLVLQKWFEPQQE
ncbi:transcriptional regulator [Desmospora sp. 8437]|nr:transcriptional regulator [Desmospora sp. 8437]